MQRDIVFFSTESLLKHYRLEDLSLFEAQSLLQSNLITSIFGSIWVPLRESFPGDVLLLAGEVAGGEDCFILC